MQLVAPHSDAPAVAVDSDGERTCVVCRTASTGFALLRITNAKGALAIGDGGTGRGAYVCVRRACLSALSARHLGRALRTAVELPDGAEWLATLAQLAAQRVLQALGLAQRARSAVLGTELVRAAQGTLALVLVASDATERTAAQWPEARRFGDKATLGLAVGAREVAIIGLPPGHHADRAGYWLGVWYESRAEEATQASMRAEEAR